MDYYSKQLIYDDCNTILSLISSIQKNPIVAVEFTPFLSLFCGEALNYCHKNNVALQPIQNSKGFSVNDIRLKLKLFEDTYSKSHKIITNCDYLQDYIFKHKLRFKMMQKWNIHYNLGIILDEAKNIVGNSQYGYYIFRDNKLLKKRLEDVQRATNTKSVEYEIVPEEIREYGQYCGEVVGSISRIFNDGQLIDKKIESENLHIDLYYKDFNTNKHFSYLYMNDDGKILFLYVLHVLTFVNSAIKLFGLFEKDDFGWWLRLYYITFHYAIKRITDIKNHLDNNRLATKSINLELSDILNEGVRTLSHSQFRNCMMHYDLHDEYGNFLISPEHLDRDVPLFGLVETCYDGIAYAQLKLKIFGKLNQISLLLTKWLDITINNPIKF